MVAFVGRQNFCDAVDVERIFRNEAARGGYVGSVERGETGVASENAKDADAFMRAEGGALAGNKFFGASDGSGKADAVFGALNVVVHRFGNGDDGHAGGGKSCGEGEGSVARYCDDGRVAR